MPEQPDVGGDRKWLTYDEATPEQVAAVRENFRRKLAEARKRHTPEYFADLRARLGFPSSTP
jgi:hypothetical protein